MNCTCLCTDRVEMDERQLMSFEKYIPSDAVVSLWEQLIECTLLRVQNRFQRKRIYIITSTRNPNIKHPVERHKQDENKMDMDKIPEHTQ